MTCEAVISDWNGTLFKDIDEEAILRTIATDLARSYLPWHPLKIAHLLKVKQELESLNNKRMQDRGSDRVIEMFRIYNEKVIKDAPISLVNRSVEKYSNMRHVRDKIIHSALRPIAERHRAGLTTGILSAGYRYGIQMILKSAAYDDCFDFYEANPLEETDGKAIRFKLNVYKNKAEILQRLLKERNLEAKRVAYLGDGMDDTGCFELTGYPIVSFLTPEALKQQFAQQYKAFVPDDEAELMKYLKSI